MASAGGDLQPASSWSTWLVDSLQRPITEADRARAAWHLMDWLACAHLGRTSEAGQTLARWATCQPAGPIWACGTAGLQAGDAARLNGSLGSVHELDDVHRDAVVHPGDTVIPAALAVAQREGRGADELLDALVVGYEAGIRLGLLAGTAHYQHWYSTATTGVFASAMACSRLLRLSPPRWLHAMALAGMQAGGVWQCRMEPGLAKQVATGHSAQAGLAAADLAAAGVTGPLAILEGAHGWLRATGSLPPADAAQRYLQAVPATPWRIHEVSFKPWPACRHVHPAIGCALQARAAGIQPAQVLRLELATYAVALSFADQPAPATSHEARFSLQHALAWALCHADFWLDASEPAALSDPVCAAMRTRVQVDCGATQQARYPQRFSARLVVHLQGGTTQVFEEDSAWGDPEHPMPPASLQDKARRMFASAGLPSDPAQALVTACLALPGQASLAHWWSCLRALGLVAGQAQNTSID